MVTTWLLVGISALALAPAVWAAVHPRPHRKPDSDRGARNDFLNFGGE